MISRDWKQCLKPYLTDGIWKLIEPLSALMPVEELRIRAGQPVQLIFSGKERLIRRESGVPAVSAADCDVMLQKICSESLYAWEAELKRGFVTLPGGCRVGLSGSTSAADGGFLTGDVTGFNFRIARAVHGASERILPCIRCGAELLPSLIVSPPGYGKTTVLREIARQASGGLSGLRACRVCVVDTRYELAGSVGGAPQLDLGPRTDVLSGVQKAEGMRMMITNMAPELLITDELSTAGEAQAALEAGSCGVTLIASAHAGDIRGLMARTAIRQLAAEGVFQRYVLLDKERGQVAGVYDQDFQRIEERAPICSVS